MDPKRKKNKIKYSVYDVHVHGLILIEYSVYHIHVHVYGCIPIQYSVYDVHGLIPIYPKNSYLTTEKKNQFTFMIISKLGYVHFTCICNIHNVHVVYSLVS